MYPMPRIMIMKKLRLLTIGNRDAAKSIGDFIRCTNIIEEEVSESSDETPNVDFTLILGRDFDSRYVHGQTSSGDNAPGSSQ